MKFISLKLIKMSWYCDSQYINTDNYLFIDYILFTNNCFWYRYYLNGREAKLHDFLNPDTFALLENQIKLVKDITNKTGYNNTPIWLSMSSIKS